MAKKCKKCGDNSGFYDLCRKCYFDEAAAKEVPSKDAEKTDNSSESGVCKTCGTKTERKNYTLCKTCYAKDSKESKSHIERTYSKKAIIKEIGIEQTDIRKKWEAMHRCDDGHYVRSYSEMLIDNWLYHNDYVHAYENSVFLPENPDETLLSDFFIPKNKVYIEFWGLNNDAYSNRKDYKIKLYESNGLNLINLEEEDIKRLNDIMPRLLHKFKI